MGLAIRMSIQKWSPKLGHSHSLLENQILYAESECRFEAVDLPVGPCRLEAWVEIDGKPCGFRFVEIEKL